MSAAMRPTMPHVMTRQASDESSTVSVSHGMTIHKAATPTRPRVSFNQTTRIYSNGYEYVEPSNLWYSRTDIRGFLGGSSQAAAAVTNSASASRRRRVQQVYQMYSNGLDATAQGYGSNSDADDAQKHVGLDRLAIHAHLHSRYNQQRRRLLRRLSESQDIADLARRERLVAQASHAVSEPAVLAATHLAQWLAKENDRQRRRRPQEQVSASQ